MGKSNFISTHSEEALKFIAAELNNLGIEEYRFCIENDCYVCDRMGRFYSVCKRQSSKSGNLVEKYRITPLAGSIDKYGYITYRIAIDGRKMHLKAHRMMLNAWLELQPDLVVNHKDGNKQNNALDNLEWCTVAENNAHAIATGLVDPYKRKGQLRTIPSYDWITIYILYKHCGYSYSKLGRLNGCAHETIKRVVEKVERVLPTEVAYGQ